MGPDERLCSSREPERGGSSMGDGPLCGERPETDEQSETSDGAPSADICEKADGDGSGVSIKPECLL